LSPYFCTSTDCTAKPPKNLFCPIDPVFCSTPTDCTPVSIPTVPPPDPSKQDELKVCPPKLPKVRASFMDAPLSPFPLDWRKDKAQVGLSLSYRLFGVSSTLSSPLRHTNRHSSGSLFPFRYTLPARKTRWKLTFRSVLILR